MNSITCTAERFAANTPTTIHCALPSNDPSWTDVFSAWGTVGATCAAVLFGIVSLFFARHEYKARKREGAERAQQDREAEQRHNRQQAERVASWLSIDLSRYPSFQIIVENSSDQPIWETSVKYRGLPADRSFLPVIPAHARKMIPLQPDQSLEREHAVEILFRDNAGRTWSRPAQVPGMLKLERDSTFAELLNGAPPTLYRASAVRDWLHDHWPVKKQGRQKRNGG